MKAVEVKESLGWDWMRPEAVSIQREATIEEAVSKMRRFSVHYLLVMKGGEFQGLLDARDCAGIWDKETKVAEVMETGIAPVDENTDGEEVVARMVNCRLSALPLMRNETVQGIITATDLLRLLQAELSHRNEVTYILRSGKNFLTRPFIQSLSNFLGNAGL